MRCPHCGKDFKLKRDKWQTIIYIAIFIFILFSVWAYRRDMAACQALLKDCNPLINPLKNIIIK